ncbi:MAG: HD domain-containing protein [Methanobacterium sp.]
MNGSLEESIQKIIKLAKSQFVLEDHNIHGFDHWEEVEQNGIMLANQPGVDVTVVRLFAYLHDCKRLDDFQDPEHGDRSAEFVKEIDSLLNEFLNRKQIDQLWSACKYHHKGVTNREDITIGACFDSDRIELIRCGYIPKPELMNTPMGIRIAEKMQCLSLY